MLPSHIDKSLFDFALKIFRSISLFRSLVRKINSVISLEKNLIKKSRPSLCQEVDRCTVIPLYIAPYNYLYEIYMCSHF